MSVNELNLTINHINSINSTRVLGVIGIIFAPALYIGWFFHSGKFNEPSANQLFSSIFGVLYLSGAMASAVAMRRLRITGSGTGAKLLFVVQIVGLFLAMWYDIFEYVAPHLRKSTVFFITDMAYPFSHVLMIIVGVAIVRAGVWRGWRRVPAFLVGLALPSFFGLSALVGRENGGFIFPLFVTLGFFLLGYAITTTDNRKVNFV
jgi:hypothetical protein